MHLGPNIDRLLAGLNARHLQEWRWVFEYEPFREHWADARNAIMTQAELAAGGIKSKASDHIPEFVREPVEPPDPEQAAQEAIAWALSCGAKVVNN